MSALAALERRNVIRMAGLYLVGAWLVVQVSSMALPMFGAPDWLPRTVAWLPEVEVLHDEPRFKVRSDGIQASMHPAAKS